MMVIPAFAVGRTQTLMYYLRELEDAQRIPQAACICGQPDGDQRDRHLRAAS